MPVPPAPAAPPDLFGSSADERENSRGPDFLRLNWPEAPTATRYDLLLNSTLLLNQPRGVTLSGLSPDTGQALAVRAANIDGESPFTSARVLTTRPPTPAAP